VSGKRRDEIERELLAGPARTDEEIAAVTGCTDLTLVRRIRPKLDGGAQVQVVRELPDREDVDEVEEQLERGHHALRAGRPRDGDPHRRHPMPRRTERRARSLSELPEPATRSRDRAALTAFLDLRRPKE
jgi:hypothetical protein